MRTLSLKAAHSEEIDLFLGQITPATSGKVLLGQAREVYAVEFRHPISKALEDPAHDTVATAVDLYPRLIAVSLT